VSERLDSGQRSTFIGLDKGLLTDYTTQPDRDL